MFYIIINDGTEVMVLRARDSTHSLCIAESLQQGVDSHDVLVQVAGRFGRTALFGRLPVDELEIEQKICTPN